RSSTATDRDPADWSLPPTAGPRQAVRPAGSRPAPAAFPAPGGPQRRAPPVRLLVGPGRPRRGQGLLAPAVLQPARCYRRAAPGQRPRPTPGPERALPSTAAPPAARSRIPLHPGAAAPAQRHIRARLRLRLRLRQEYRLRLRLRQEYR